jgi:hypothetical protein
MLLLRKLLIAALLCGSALAVAPEAHAAGLSTQPNDSGAMLIPTFSTGVAKVQPVYWHRHYYRRHYYRRHWHHR